MIQEFAEQEYFVLHLLSVSNEPLGAGSIRDALGHNDDDPQIDIIRDVRTYWKERMKDLSGKPSREKAKNRKK